MSTRLALGAVCAVVACARGGARSDSAAAAAAPTVMTVIGVVRVVGADPLTQLVIQGADGGPPTAIVGPLEAELRQAVGVEVRVTGPAADPAPPSRAAVQAQSYEAIALNGVPAYVGTIERSGDGLNLVGARRWLLLNPPAELRESVGAKAWVAGETSAGGLRVSGYGILRR
jgi:hypothetical protein